MPVRRREEVVVRRSAALAAAHCQKVGQVLVAERENG